MAVVVVMTEFVDYGSMGGDVCPCTVWWLSPSGAAAVPDFCAEPRPNDGWPQWQRQVHCMAGPDEGPGETGGGGGSGARDRAKGEQAPLVGGEAGLIHPTVAAAVVVQAITKEELYGVLDPNTREWTDGLFTHILRK